MSTFHDNEDIRYTVRAHGTRLQGVGQSLGYRVWGNLPLICKTNTVAASLRRGSFTSSLCPLREKFFWLRLCRPMPFVPSCD